MMVETFVDDLGIMYQAKIFFSEGRKNQIFRYMNHTFNITLDYITILDIIKNTEIINKPYIYSVLDSMVLFGLVKKIKRVNKKQMVFVKINHDLWDDINNGINKQETNSR